ncbi:MAG: hypothetical protein Q9215_000912 [Flavoplaca cf. flavocitrina]
MLSFLLPVLLFPWIACAAETILGVFIFSRHGDRTAKSTPPATLTNLGYSQVFTSGTYFRNRYIAPNGASRILGVNSDIVEQSQIAVSAPIDTVLTNAAQAFLQGSYPPAGPELASDTLRDGRVVRSPLDGYQLIPIRPVSSGKGSEDIAWLQASSNCPEAIVSSDEYFSSSDYNNLLASTDEFYTSLTPLINATFSDDEINYKNAYANPIRAIAGSTLAAQVVRGLENTIKSQGKSKITIEFGAYASFLSFFGLADLLTLPESNDSFMGIPDYASTMTFELFTTADASSFPAVEDLQVRFLFHNGTIDENGTLNAYPLFGQPSTELSWTKFREGMNRFAVSGPEQWCEACGNSTGVCTNINAPSPAVDNTTGSGSRSGISQAVAGIIGALVTLAVVLGVQVAVILFAGLRVVRKKRAASREMDESGAGAADERKL